MTVTSPGDSSHAVASWPRISAAYWSALRPTTRCRVRLASRITPATPAARNAASFTEASLPTTSRNRVSAQASTRWTLPSDTAWTLFGASGTPLRDAVLALDGVQAADDPIGSLGDWQRDRLASWRATGRLEDAPLLWASITHHDGRRWLVRLALEPHDDLPESCGKAAVAVRSWTVSVDR